MIAPVYAAAENRYECGMQYRRAGRSGVMLPAISLGLWHNFGDVDTLSLSRKKLHYAFDHGITHFDLANNYGPSYGSAEETFGQIIKSSLAPYRDELFISTKAGHDMWPGPYGNWGSRKHLMASLEQSLKRMNLEYVDVFYSHRYDPETPLEETLQTLVDIVHQGKALYVGLSKYPLEAYLFASRFLKERDVPCLLYQGRYSMLVREPESQGILQAVRENGGGVCGLFSFGARLADQSLLARHSRGFPYCPWRLLEKRGTNAGSLEKDSGIERTRTLARTIVGRDGIGLAAERCVDHFRVGGSQFGGTIG